MAARAARSSRISGKSNESGPRRNASTAALARAAHQNPAEHQKAEEYGFRGDECERVATGEGSGHAKHS